MQSEKPATESAKQKLLELFDDVLAHDGFGEIRVETKILNSFFF